MEDPRDQEHVMRAFYRSPNRFRIFNIENRGCDYSAFNLSIDTPNDFKVFLKILEKMSKPFTDYSWEEIVQLYKEVDLERRVSLESYCQ